jgi:quercetin dioxygenase-like cupin family protein
MSGIAVKNVRAPDERRSLGGKGAGNVLEVDGRAVLFVTYEPGWRWSEHVKPMAGTDRCEMTHVMYCISGRLNVVHDDGSEADLGPGDVAVIEPGHDAWVVGDEPYVAVDFGAYRHPVQRGA